MPQELIKHKCINLRTPTRGGLYVWEFAEGGRELSVRVDGQLIVNGIDQMLHAALDGVGLAYALEDVVAEYVAVSAWCKCCTTDARASPATACTFRAAASRHQLRSGPEDARHEGQRSLGCGTSGEADAAGANVLLNRADMILHATLCFVQLIVDWSRHGKCMPLMVASKMPLPAILAVLSPMLRDSNLSSMSIL